MRGGKTHGTWSMDQHCKLGGQEVLVTKVSERGSVGGGVSSDDKVHARIMGVGG
jgi:hypothetical protein